MIALILLAFALGYVMGKQGNLYIYHNGELSSKVGIPFFYTAYPRMRGFIIDLVGVDFSNNQLAPVYKPTIGFAKAPAIWSMAFRMGDFDELVLLFSYKTPFFKARYIRDITKARSIE